MKVLAATSSVLFITCFVYLMISAYALRWMIDEQKIKTGGSKIFRSITPPREVLTALGVKIWWSRWIALSAGAGFLALTLALKGHLK